MGRYNGNQSTSTYFMSFGQRYNMIYMIYMYKMIHNPIGNNDTYAYAYLSKDKNFLFKKRIVKIFYVWNVLKIIWSIINWILILNIWHFELYDLQRLSDAAYLIGSDSL